MIKSILSGRLWAAVCMVLVAGATRARADDVMGHVPADASVVIKVKNLQGTSDQLAGLANQFGVALINPALNDPLGMAMQASGISAGVDKAGDMAVALMTGDDLNAPPQALALIPVSDYQAFLGNFADAKTEGAVTSFTAPMSPMPLFATHWGGYAAVTINKELLATPPAGLVVKGPVGGEVASKDIVVFVNLKVMGPKIIKGIDQLRQKVTAGPGAAATKTKYFGDQAVEVGDDGVIGVGSKGIGMGDGSGPSATRPAGGAVVVRSNPQPKLPTASEPADGWAELPATVPAGDDKFIGAGGGGNGQGMGIGMGGQPNSGGTRAIGMGPGEKNMMLAELSLVEHFLKDAEAASWGVSLSKDGIGITAMADFSADSSLGVLAAGMKNTDATLLARLPDQAYLAWGGWRVDGKAISALIGSEIMPALDRAAKGQEKMTDEEREEQGSDVRPIIAMAKAYQALFAATSDGVFGMMPPGAPGKGGIIRMVGAYGGDPKALIDAEHQFLTAEEGMMGTMGGPAKLITTTFTPDARTVDGVSLARMQMKFATGNAPGAMVLNMLYGPDGFNFFMGAADASQTVVAANVEDATISQVIAAARGGQDAVGAKAPVVAVAGKLPANRLGVLYLSLDGVAEAISGYLPLVGGPALQLNLPADLQPVGIAIATDHNAFRYDVYVPTRSVQAVVGAVMQAKMNMMRQGQPGGGMGPGL